MRAVELYFFDLLAALALELTLRKRRFCREFPDVFEVAGLGVLTPRNLDAILDRHAASLTSTADGHALDEARSLGAGVLDGVVVQPLRAGVMPGAGQAAELELGLLDPRLARLSPATV